MLSRIFGILLLIIFAGSLYLIYGNLDTIQSEYPADLSLISAFLLPIALGLLSVAMMYIFGFVVQLFNVSDMLAPSRGGVFGVMVTHAIGFSLFLVLMINFFSTSAAFESVGQAGLYPVIGLLYVAAFAGVYLSVFYEKRERYGLLGGSLFLLSLIGLSIIIAVNSPDILDSVKGTIVLFLIFPSLAPLVLVLASIYGFTRHDDTGNVSAPEIFMPYAFYLILIVAAGIAGAALQLIASWL